MEGTINKWTNLIKGWQTRYVVLDFNSCTLSYYRTREDMLRGLRRGCVILKNAKIGIDDQVEVRFTINVDSKTFHFLAKDGFEREKWVRCLESAIRGYDLFKLNNSNILPNIPDFHKKITETDAYLQLILNLSKSLETRMKSQTNPEDKEKYEAILHHTKNFVEHIKHLIVLLQITKNTVDPLCGSLEFRESSDSEISLESQPAVTTAVVPQTSYSSSEEDFYDAQSSGPEQTIETQVSSKKQDKEITQERDEETNTSEQSEHKSDKTEPVPSSWCKEKKTWSFIKKDGQIDYEALHDDTVGLDSQFDSQSSVVSHLISQVRVGMDLTRVTLPTFILESRSLLEMYGDHFAHPDMFVRIADIVSPRERMIQVVRWYLCSYHAGRQSSIAKKPYNPILGELFKCHWDIAPNEQETSTSDRTAEAEVVLDGPLPWCRQDQLTFIAQQVSHHPPVSAFYAEHYNKKISFSAYIWTKSRYLGLSVCVNNIGHGVVDVLKYAEQYVVNFPNGYGRSIFGIPWIELGGPCTIDCKKTGYRAAIEFLTKPFYGGDKHKLICEVFSPNEKRPFLTIDGAWNGVMNSQWTDRPSELFVDVDQLPVSKKNVQPFELLDDNESRKIWLDVTIGLKTNNIDEATTAKQKIEDEQRKAAEVRKENGVKWKPAFFVPDGEDGWLYKYPLSGRLKTI